MDDSEELLLVEQPGGEEEQLQLPAMSAEEEDALLVEEEDNPNTSDNDDDASNLEKTTLEPKDLKDDDYELKEDEHDDTVGSTAGAAAAAAAATEENYTASSSSESSSSPRDELHSPLELTSFLRKVLSMRQQQSARRGAKNMAAVQSMMGKLADMNQDIRLTYSAALAEKNRGMKADADIKKLEDVCKEMSQQCRILQAEVNKYRTLWQSEQQKSARLTHDLTGLHQELRARGITVPIAAAAPRTAANATMRLQQQHLQHLQQQQQQQLPAQQHLQQRSFGMQQQPQPQQQPLRLAPVRQMQQPQPIFPQQPMQPQQLPQPQLTLAEMRNQHLEKQRAQLQQPPVRQAPPPSQLQQPQRPMPPPSQLQQQPMRQVSARQSLPSQMQQQSPQAVAKNVQTPLVLQRRSVTIARTAAAVNAAVAAAAAAQTPLTVDDDDDDIQCMSPANETMPRPISLQRNPASTATPPAAAATAGQSAVPAAGAAGASFLTSTPINRKRKLTPPPMAAAPFALLEMPRKPCSSFHVPCATTATKKLVFKTGRRFPTRVPGAKQHGTTRPSKEIPPDCEKQIRESQPGFPIVRAGFSSQDFRDSKKVAGNIHLTLDDDWPEDTIRVCLFYYVLSNDDGDWQQSDFVTVSVKDRTEKEIRIPFVMTMHESYVISRPMERIFFVPVLCGTTIQRRGPEFFVGQGGPQTAPLAVVVKKA